MIGSIVAYRSGGLNGIMPPEGEQELFDTDRGMGYHKGGARGAQRGFDFTGEEIQQDEEESVYHSGSQHFPLCGRMRRRRGQGAGDDGGGIVGGD